MNTEIAVIGAGLGGASAALRLADAGKAVTLVDPHTNTTEPLPTQTRRTIPLILRSVSDSLGLPTSEYPVISHVRFDHTGWALQKIVEPGWLCAIDALSARRALLQQAKQHPNIQVLEGKVADILIDSAETDGGTTGIRLDDDRVIHTGKDGMIVVATGRNTRLLPAGTVVEDELESRTGRRAFGAYISSPALAERPRDTLEMWQSRFAGTLAPAEQIEEGGTDFAIFFVTRSDEILVYESAKGGPQNMLATMQAISAGSSWEKYFLGANIDRLLLHRYAKNIIRRPTVGGLVLVGDARASLDPGLKKGVDRIDLDTAFLQRLVADEHHIPFAVDKYNKSPIITNETQ